MDMNHRDLKLEIERYRENDDLTRISTTYSDEMYPWTAGKAPWSVEQGGTGITPTGARNNINITAQKNKSGPSRQNIDSKAGIVKLPTIESFKNLNPSNLDGTIDGVNELHHCYTLIQSLLQKAKNFHVNEVRSSEKDNVICVIDEVDASLEILKNTSFKETNARSSHSPPRSIKRERRSRSPCQRSLSPPRYHQPSPRAFQRSPEHDRNSFKRETLSPSHSSSRSPTSRSSREYDTHEHVRTNESSRDYRSSRHDREGHFGERYRERDSYDHRNRDGRDRSNRR